MMYVVWVWVILRDANYSALALEKPRYKKKRKKTHVPRKVFQRQVRVRAPGGRRLEKAASLIVKK